MVAGSKLMETQIVPQRPWLVKRRTHWIGGEKARKSRQFA